MRAGKWATGGATLTLAAALAAVGCDWRTFDDLKNNTPVLAIGAPSGYPAGDDFGPILQPLPPPADGSAAGRFVATATHRTSVAVMSFDAAGRVSGKGVTGTAFDMLAQGPITAIAAIPGSNSVLLGAPAADLGTVLVMNVDPPFQTTTFQNVAEAQYGVGVAAGDLGNGGAPEIVVLSSHMIHVFVDSVPAAEFPLPSRAAPDPCSIDFSASLPDRDRVNRAVMIASLTGNSAKQIAVGTPSVSGAGHIVIFDFDTDTGQFICSATLTAPEAHFGLSMTLVDVDGDGAPDSLLVGAPPTHAYLFTLPLSTNQAPAAMATDTMTNGDFGASVAAFDIDGKPGDEMFVGNPDATVNGSTTAGRVSIYTGASMTMLSSATIPNPLALHEPKAGGGYGSGVAGMPFCPGNVGTGADGGASGTSDAGVAACTTLPLVGALSKVYTYFTLKKPDPRVK
jgi:hypothetical protein